MKLIRRTKEERAKMLQHFRESGLSKEAYARQFGVSSNVLYQAIRERKENDLPGKFISISENNNYRYRLELQTGEKLCCQTAEDVKMFLSVSKN